jgi:anti-anti-sigma regulatory factor
MFRDLLNGPAIAFGATKPMLKIHRTSGRTVVFTVSGRLDSDHVNELCQVIDAEPAGGVLVLDLTDLVLADRDAVRILRQYEARGRVVLRNCPAYVRTWMAGEHDQP